MPEVTVLLYAIITVLYNLIDVGGIPRYGIGLGQMTQNKGGFAY
jgi:hypothetical protein